MDNKNKQGSRSYFWFYFGMFCLFAGVLSLFNNSAGMAAIYILIAFPIILFSGVIINSAGLDKCKEKILSLIGFVFVILVVISITNRVGTWAISLSNVEIFTYAIIVIILAYGVKKYPNIALKIFIVVISITLIFVVINLLGIVFGGGNTFQRYYE